MPKEWFLTRPDPDGKPLASCSKPTPVLTIGWELARRIMGELEVDMHPTHSP
ncbi:MAG: hypothetical protein LBD79_05200 [Treponema sp.]|nr:hypothetical protein [Treponema sp.]